MKKLICFVAAILTLHSCPIWAASMEEQFSDNISNQNSFSMGDLSLPDNFSLSQESTGNCIDDGMTIDQGTISFEDQSMEADVNEEIQIESQEKNSKFPSSSAELQSSFNSFVLDMNSKLPTLEAASIDSLRTELTESMRINAESTLKGMMGSSFTGLNSDLFGSASLPEVNREMLNIDYASMREAFEKANSSISGNNLGGSLDSGSLSISVGTEMEDLEKRMEEVRNSKQYKTVNGKISLSNVFGSLSNTLPSKK